MQKIFGQDFEEVKFSDPRPETFSQDLRRDLGNDSQNIYKKITYVFRKSLFILIYVNVSNNAPSVTSLKQIWSWLQLCMYRKQTQIRERNEYQTHEAMEISNALEFGPSESTYGHNTRRKHTHTI